MGLALDRMEQESRALQEALATGAAVVELDTTFSRPVIVRDRLSQFERAAFAALRRSIEEHGQEMPILVRPHPNQEGAIRWRLAIGG